MRSTGEIADIFNTFDENSFDHAVDHITRLNVLFIFSVKVKNFTFSLGVSR